MNKKRNIRLISFLLSAIMLISLFPVNVFADVTTERNSVSSILTEGSDATVNDINIKAEVNQSTGAISFTLEKNSEVGIIDSDAVETSLSGKYLFIVNETSYDSDTESDLNSQINTAVTNATETNIKFSELNINSQSVTSKINKESLSENISDIGSKIFTLYKQDATTAELLEKIKNLGDTTLSLQNYKTALETYNTLSTQIKNTIFCKEQKDFLINKINAVKETIDTFIANKKGDIMLEDFNYSIASFTDFDSFLEDLDKVTNLEQRQSLLNKYVDKLKSKSEYITYGLNSLNYSLSNFLNEIELDGKVVTFDSVEFYFLDTNDAVLIFKTKSGDVKSLNQDLLKEYLQKEAINYIQDTVREHMNIKTVFLTESVKSNGSFLTNSLYDRKIFDYIGEDFINYYEYLNFTPHIYREGNDLKLFMVGDFDRKDSDWITRNISGFEHYLTYDVAEPIVRDFNSPLDIKVYDRDLDIVYTKKIEKTNLFNSSATYQSLINKLKSDFNKFNGLEFDYVVNSERKTVNVRIIGKNFREKYDIWENTNKEKFETWVDKIGEYVISEKEMDVSIKVVDKSNRELYRTTLYKEDYIAAVKDIENYLNDNFYKKDGVYFEYALTRGATSNLLRVKCDTPNGYRLSDELTSKELSDFSKTIAEEVMKKYPKDLSITFSGVRVSSKTFSYYYKFFEELRTFENNWNGKIGNFKTPIDLDYKNNRVYVKMKFDNYYRNDDEVKELDKDKNFKNELEKEIVTPLMKITNSSVSITIKDKDHKDILSKTYGTHYKRVNKQEVLRDLRDKLNKECDYIFIDGQKVKVYYSYSDGTNPVFYAKVNTDKKLEDSSASVIGKSIYKELSKDLVNNFTVQVKDDRNKVKFKITQKPKDIKSEIVSDDNIYINTVFAEFVEKNSKIQINANSGNIIMDSIAVKKLKKKNIKFSVITKYGDIELKMDQATYGSFDTNNNKINTNHLINSVNIIKAKDRDKIKFNSTDTNKYFSDVTFEYAPYVNTLNENGIMMGYGNGKYGGMNNLTRAEFATILIRIIDKYDLPVTKKVDSAVDFVDISGHWAENTIKEVSQYGIIEGYENGMFKPQASISKAETLVLIARAMGDKGDNSKNWKHANDDFLINSGIISETSELDFGNINRYGISEYLYKAFIK